MFISSYLIFTFFSINWFLIFTPIFQFIHFNSFLIWTTFLSLVLLINHPFLDSSFFSGIFMIDSYGIIITSLFSLFFIAYLYSLYDTSVSKFKELPLLLLIINMGFTTFIISNDLIILYLSIELFSLTFYLITTIHQNYYTTEAGIKYFIYNFIAGAFYLLGCALIYSEFATINLTQISELMLTVGSFGGVYLGWILIIISFLFKLSVAPFHFWTPDVYQGVLYPITGFFTIFPKFLIATFFVKLYVIILSTIPNLNYYLFGCGLFSIFIGGIGALNQYNIKRLFAYSTILNSGFFITLIGLGTPLSTKVLIFSLLTYIIANLGLFSILTNINTASGLGLKNNGLLTGLLLSIPILSLAGVPPFVGFLGKFLTIYLVVGNGLYFIAAMMILFSIISLYYYLRIVHYALLFNNGTKKTEIKKNTSYIIVTVNFLLLAFTLNPSFIFLISSVLSNLI